MNMHYNPTYAGNRAVHASPYVPTMMHRAPAQSYGYGGGRMPVVELIVPMCCTKEKIRENMLELRGVQSVFVDLQTQRVVVTGFVDPIKVLKKAKKVKRDSVLYTGAAAAAAASSYGGSEYFAPGSKYRRSEYRPSLYRTSSYELRRPSVYRSSSLEYRPSGYRSSFNQSGNQYTPSSYGQSSSFVPQPMLQSSCIDPYSYRHGITNPHFSKHIQSEYY